MFVRGDRGSRSGVVGLCLVVLVGLTSFQVATGGAAQADDDPAPTCTVSATLVNSCRPWYGGTANDYDGLDDKYNKLVQMEAMEDRVGRQLEVAHTYHGPTKDADRTLDATDRELATRGGSYLFLNWRPTDDWARGVGGDAEVDARIDAMGSSIKALGDDTKMFLALSGEPENKTVDEGSCPDGTAVGTEGTIEQYRAMWANVQDRFDALGVNNVVWVMNFQGNKTWNCKIDDLWPGDDRVDWITYNGYQHGDKNGTKVDFVGNVSPFYSFLTEHSDPGHDYLSKAWGLSEWGVRNTSQSNAYRYYAQARKAVEDDVFPRLKMYMVFDSGDDNANFRVGCYESGEPDADDPVEQQAYNAFAHTAALGGDGSHGDTEGPDAPVVTATDPADGPVTLSWTPAEDDVATAAYRVYRNGVKMTAAAKDLESLTWTDRTTSPGFVYTVTAVDSSGNESEPSAPIHLDRTAPEAPTGLAGALDTQGRPTLSWTAAADDVVATSYDVLRDGVTVGTTSGLAFTDDQAPVAVPSVYTVRASDAAGNVGPESSSVTVTRVDTTAPGVPGAVSGSLVDGTPRITWTEPTDDVGVVSYDVLRGGTVIGTTTGLSYDDTGAPVGSASSYTVRAVDAASNKSIPSSSVTVTVPKPDTTPPTVPTKVTAVMKNGAPTITWAASTDAGGVASYDVLRSGTTVGTVSSGRTFVDSAAPQGRTWTYTVKARDVAGNLSASSAGARLTVPDRTAPTAPGSLTVTRSGTRAVLRWTAATDNVAVSRYWVYRGTTRVANLAAGARSFTATGLRSGTKYTFKVVARDAAGNQGPALSATG